MINCQYVTFAALLSLEEIMLSAAYLDGDDQLRDDRQDLAASSLEHVLNSLNCQEAVGIERLPDAIEEDGQVMVVVELLNVNLKHGIRR